jgi:20S proteasome alpha/beta subunit
LDWETYRDRPDRINPQLYMILDEYLTSFTLETDFLVVGIDEYGGHVLSVDFPGTIQYLDKIGFGAVGSGVPHATVSLCLDGQMRNRSLAETLYAVYVSKKKAEPAPGVGAETDMGVITSNGICFLEEAHMKALASIYADSSKRVIDLSSLGKVCEEINSKK